MSSVVDTMVGDASARERPARRYEPGPHAGSVSGQYMMTPLTSVGDTACAESGSIPLSSLAVLSKTGWSGKPERVCVAVWLRVCDRVCVIDAVRVTLGVAEPDGDCDCDWLELGVCV